MNCKELPFLLPRITELLEIEQELVSHYKYSDLVYYQLCSTKNFMQTKQLYVLTSSLQIKYYFGVLTDAIEMPERHDTSACTKTPAATTEQFTSLHKPLLLLKLQMKELLVSKAGTFGQAFLNDTNSSEGVKAHLSRSKLSNLFLSLFFSLLTQVILAIHHHLCLLLLFLSILHITQLQFDYTDPMQYRCHSGISISGGFQESPGTLTDLIQCWGHWHFKWELGVDDLQRSLTSTISMSLCKQKQREGLRHERGGHKTQGFC